MLDIMMKLQAPKVTAPETTIPPEVLTFLMAEFIAIKVRAGSHNTRLAYMNDLRRLGDFTMGDLSNRKLLAFKLKVIDHDEQGNARALRSANRILSTCRKFLRFLCEKQVLATNYLELVDGHSIDKHDSPYIALSDAEVRSMIDYPNRDTVLGASQRLALVLGFYLGLRCSEITSIKYGDIDNGILSVNGKGRKVRRIPLSETLLNELYAYIDMTSIKGATPDPKRHLIESRESGGHKIASSTVWRWYTSIARACGIEKHFSPHSARATAITKALDSGVGIRDVSNLAGHVSIETTAIYDKRRGEASRVVVASIKY